MTYRLAAYLYGSGQVEGSALFCYSAKWMKIESVVLQGDLVRLEPLRFDHLPALCKVALDPSIWEFSPEPIAGESDVENYVRAAMAEEKLGTTLPFVTISKEDGRVVGSTRFGNIDIANRRVEIGWTWLNPQWQRTGINTEAKLLMFTHAFEHWKCIRVELKTDVLNKRSRRAIKRLGCREEGVLRSHMITRSGRVRDSIYFSVIEGEWPIIKDKLIARLAVRVG